MAENVMYPIRRQIVVTLSACLLWGGIGNSSLLQAQLFRQPAPPNNTKSQGSYPPTSTGQQFGRDNRASNQRTVPPLNNQNPAGKKQSTVQRPGQPRPASPTYPSQLGQNQRNSNQPTYNPKANNLQPNRFSPGPVNQPSREPSSSAANRFNTSPLPNRQNALSSRINDQEKRSESGAEPISEESLQPLDKATLAKRFGMQLHEHQNELVVQQIDPEGNAARIGVQAGDVVRSIGGATISSMNEYAQIVSLLSVGDQIEIEVERNGQTRKEFIRFGESSAGSEENSNEGEGSAASQWATSANNEQERLQILVSQQQQVIRELQARIRELESRTQKSKF